MMIQSPLWLLGLLPVVWMAHRPPRLPGLAYSGSANQPTPIDRWATWWGRWSRVRYGALLGACVVVLSSPGHYQQSVTPLRYRASVVVIVDTSRSMLSMDFKPQHRLQSVKEDVMTWVKRNPGVEWSIMSMGESIYTQTPLTANPDLVLDAIQQIQVGAEGEGSNWGVALVGGVNRLRESAMPNKWVVLITDGASTGHEINPIQATQVLRAHGVALLAIGLHSLQGLPVPLYSPTEGPHYERSLDGGLVIPSLDTRLLTQMASLSNGWYQPVQSGQSILSSLTAISNAWPTQPDYHHHRRWVSWNPWIVAIMMGLLVIEIGLSCTRFRGIG